MYLVCKVGVRVAKNAGDLICYFNPFFFLLNYDVLKLQPSLYEPAGIQPDCLQVSLQCETGEFIAKLKDKELVILDPNEKKDLLFVFHALTLYLRRYEMDAFN